MNLTKRSHYNPCAWTALWNESYFEKLILAFRRREGRELKSLVR